MRRLRFLLLVVVAIALLLPFTFRRADRLRIMLDFYPNPNHIPLYVAQELGLFAAAGIEVEIIAPTDPSDPAKLAASRAVDVALTPQMNYLIARGAGLPLLAVGALIDGALGGLLALGTSGIAELAHLRDRRIGYALEPLEPILWQTMLHHAGVQPHEVELIYVGMNTLFSLLAGQVEAIGAFRNYEALAAEDLGHPPVFFPQEEYGVPDTYELVIVVHPVLLREQLTRVRGFLQALAEAVAFTQNHPAEALALFETAVPEIAGEELVRRSFAATLPIYACGARHDDTSRWEAMQTYLVAHGLMPQALPLADLITGEALP